MYQKYYSCIDDENNFYFYLLHFSVCEKCHCEYRYSGFILKLFSEWKKKFESL